MCGKDFQDDTTKSFLNSCGKDCKVDITSRLEACDGKIVFFEYNIKQWDSSITDESAPRYLHISVQKKNYDSGIQEDIVDEIEAMNTKVEGLLNARNCIEGYYKSLNSKLNAIKGLVKDIQQKVDELKK